MIIPEKTWADLNDLTWIEVSEHFWGGPGVVFGLNLLFECVGTVERSSSVEFNLKIEFWVNSITSIHNYNDLLLLQLPDYERESYYIQAAVRGMATIFAHIENQLNQLRLEQTVSTSSNLLSKWEALLKISGRGKTIEERRAIIRSNLWMLKNNIQETDIKQLALIATDSDIGIQKLTPHGYYNFKFISQLGKPKNLDRFTELLKKFLNAGYRWDYEFMYNTWGDVSKLTWGDVEFRTWEMIRSEDLATN